MQALIIADVAGQFDALMRLIEEHGGGRKLIFVGDLVDRGPRSKAVLDFCMSLTSEPDADCVVLKGNHEDMMVDACRGTGKYDDTIWVRNGGIKTLFSFDFAPPASRLTYRQLADAYNSVPKEYVEWMDKLPLTFEAPGLFVSHAPWPRHLELGEMKNDARWFNLFWNREGPKERPGVFQVFGHNSMWGVRVFGNWAVCLDDSQKDKLTGMLWPEKQIVQVPYEEKTNAEIQGREDQGNVGSDHHAHRGGREG